jgi:hypothetical protein
VEVFEELVDSVFVGVAVDDGPVDTGAHDSVIPAIGNVTGNEISDNGVPGGTSTVNGNFTPPTNVTVITH